MAAVLAAGIGSFAMGAFVLLNEAGLFAAPTLYGPAGGVTRRTTFATAVWLLAGRAACALEVTRRGAWTGVQVDRRPRRACDSRHVFTTVGFAVITRGSPERDPAARVRMTDRA